MTAPTTRPCPRCGYDAPGARCPHCANGVREPSLAGPAPRGFGEILAGARALPMGFSILARTSRTKRWLAPPLCATLVFFGLAFGGIWIVLSRLVSVEPARDDAGWIERVARSPFVAGVLEVSTFVALLVIGAVLAAWTFAVVYQAIAGPFLDAIQGRVEETWYGADPRERAAPKFDISSTRAVWITVLCVSIALTFLAAFVAIDSPFAWVLVLGSIAPFWIAGRRNAEYARWLSTNVRAESRTLFVSVEASLFAAVLMLVLSWTLVLPVIGAPTFAAIAGFASAITLLDIPCSRRRWSFRTRLRFVFGHFGAVWTFGLVTSALFLVPFVGPVLGVPAASIGGQWLVCRLDKSRLVAR